jgi:hypothetical protein
MTSTFPPQLGALAAEPLARSALPHAPVQPMQPDKPPRRLFRPGLRASARGNERPGESEQLALDLQALVDAGLVEFHDGPGLRRYALTLRGLELTARQSRGWA